MRKPVILCLGVVLLAGCGRRGLGHAQPAILTADELPAALAPAAAEPPQEKGSSSPAPGGDGFRFPRDRGGALLEALLTPSDVTPAKKMEGKASSSRLDAPDAPLPLPGGEAPKGVASRKRPLPRPAPPADESLPVPGARELAALEVPDLPDEKRAPLPGPDLLHPIPLPLLGTREPEPPSREDPTAEMSLAAALVAPLPPRLTPVPFARNNVPDPYELRQQGGYRTESEETALPGSLKYLPTRP